MTIWAKKPLSEVADLCLGKMLDGEKNKGSALPYLANINVRWGQFDLASLREMRFQHSELDRYGLKYGDIVMCEGGEPGRCAIWKDQIPGMMIQKALHRIRPREFLDYRFLYYFFLNKGKKGGFASLFTGSTIAHLSSRQLAKIEVVFPQIETQRYIVSILSSYDDLIENNEKRIKILEEMAQSLYTEWFVKFCFPGCENVKMVDSGTEYGMIPEGWEVVSIKNIANFMNGYPFKPKDLGDQGLPVIKIPELRSGILKKTPRNSGEGINKKYLIQTGDILFSWSATLLVNIWDSGEALLNQHLFKVTPKNKIYNTYTFYLLVLLVEKIRKHAVGATMQHLRKDAVESAKVLLPSVDMLTIYDAKASKVLKQVSLLYQKNQNLSKIRDLLIPHLITGG